MKMKPKKIRYISYQKKLAVIFAIITITVVSFLGVIMFWAQAKNERKNLYDYIKVENQKNATALSNVFESLIDLSAALVINDDIYGNLSELPYIADKTDLHSLEIKQNIFKTMLTSKLAIRNEVINMRVYSINGSYAYVTKQKSGIENNDYKDRSWYEQLVRKNKNTLLKINYIKGSPILTVVRKIIVPNSWELVGYLEINYDFSQEVSTILLEKSILGKEMHQLLSDNEIIISANKGDIGKKISYSLEEVKKAGVQIVEIDNERYILAASDIENTDFVLIDGVSYSMLTEQIQKGYLTLFIILIPSVIIAVTVSLYAAKDLTKNIKKLNKAMKEADTNLSTQINISSNDEIGMLSNSFNKMIIRLDKTYKELYEAELDLKEARNLALQAQINPHFFYNTLETIDALSVCDRTAEIGKIVQALSKVFRYAMEEKIEVTLNEELSHVRDYVRILMIRYENKITFDMQISERLLNMHMPKLILQPLVENSISHGILKKEGKGHLTILAEEEEDIISISIEDDGIGIEEGVLLRLKKDIQDTKKKERENNHIGIKNVDKRLRYFYKERYCMDIDSNLMNGTKISIFIQKE